LVEHCAFWETIQVGSEKGSAETKLDLSKEAIPMAKLFDAAAAAVVAAVVVAGHVVGPWQSFVDAAVVVAVDRGVWKNWHEFVVAIAFEIAVVEIDIGVPFVVTFYPRYCHSIAVIRFEHWYCHLGGTLERMDTCRPNFLRAIVAVVAADVAADSRSCLPWEVPLRDHAAVSVVAAVVAAVVVAVVAAAVEESCRCHYRVPSLSFFIMRLFQPLYLPRPPAGHEMSSDLYETTSLKTIHVSNM
jgi:hypothetical protein